MTAKQIIGAATVVLIAGVAAVLWIPGLYESLDKDPWIITGLAAYVTAVATAVIASFSQGTWKLFRLEEKREEARIRHLQARIQSFLVRVDGCRHTVEALDELHDELCPSTLEEERTEIIEKLEESKVHLDRLTEGAGERSQELLEPLLDARRDLSLASAGVKISVTSADRLGDAATALRRAARRLRPTTGPDREPSGDEELDRDLRESEIVRIRALDSHREGK